MANRKISELVSRVPSLTDLMLVGDPSSGYSYKCTVNDIALAVETGVAGNYVTLATTQTISGAKTFSNILTLTSVANSPTDTDKFLVLNASNVVNYRTGTQMLSDIGAADDSLVVHKAGAETITGVKTFNAGLSLPNYQQINLSNSATIEGYDGKVLFRTIFGVAGYFQNNSLGLAQMDNETGTSGIGFLVKNFGGEGLVKYKTAAQALSMIGAQGALTLTTTGSSGAATLVGNTLNIPNYGDALSGYVPYTGATTNVDLGTHTLTAKKLVINHASGSGVAASITKGGNGEALTVSKTSGSGNAMSVSGGLTSLVDLSLSSISNATTDTDRFLVSDGGVVKYRTGSELLSDIGGASASGYVPYTGATANLDLGTRSISTSQGTIVGNNSTSGGYLGFKQFSSASSGTTGLTSIFAIGTTTLGLSYSQGAGSVRTAYLSTQLISNNTAYYYDFPNKGGTFALLDDVTGAISGTTNYIPKFTSSSAIGNSVIYESSSNIGIGTTSPNTILNLYSSLPILRWQNPTSGTGVSDGGDIYLQDNDFWVRNIESGILGFATSGAERMRITSGGALLVGATGLSAQEKFKVSGSATHNGIVRFENSENQGDANHGTLMIVNTKSYAFNNDASIGFAANGSDGSMHPRASIGMKAVGNVDGALVFSTRNSSTYQERMRLDASGNLGLGVTPSAWASDWTVMQVGGTVSTYNSGAIGINTYNAFYNGTNYIYQNTAVAAVYDYNGAAAGGFAWRIAPSGTAGNAISFTQAMTLNASGRLLLNKTSDNGDRFQVNGNAYIDGQIVSAQSNGLVRTSNADAAGMLHIRPNAGQNGYINFTENAVDDRWSIGVTAGDGSFYFRRPYPTSPALVTITSGGNVGIGTTSPGSKLSIVGLPTSSSGLSAGDVWNDGGTLKIV